VGVVLWQNTFATGMAFTASLARLHAQFMKVFPGNFMGGGYSIAARLEQGKRAGILVSTIIEN
jgi:hypothetical protein